MLEVQAYYEERKEGTNTMNTPTLGDILDAFNQRLGEVEDNAEPDAEILYLETIVSELKSIEAAYVGMDSVEAQKLQAACFRIPGLLHLYKIY